jgi:hypothetical protein
MTLHIHVLSIGEDISFMYKYQDVISGDANITLDNGNGEVEEATFQDWWFAPIEKIRPDMALPEE